jgi:hypothetical protein
MFPPVFQGFLVAATIETKMMGDGTSRDDRCEPVSFQNTDMGR